MRRVNGGDDQVDHQSDTYGVDQRSHTEALPKAQPAEEHDEADDDRPGSDPEPDGAGQALMEHVPRVKPESGKYEHRRSRSVERHAAQQLHPAMKAAIPGDWLEYSTHGRSTCHLGSIATDLSSQAWQPEPLQWILE